VHNDTRAALRAVVRRVPVDDLVARLPGDETVLREQIEVFVRWLTEEIPPTRAELEGPIRRAASVGEPMEDGLRRYREAAQAGWDALVAAADERERAALLRGVDVLFAYVNAVTDLFAEVYGEEVSTSERRARELLARLVAPGPLDADALALAERLGLALPEAYAPFAAELAGAPPHRHAALAAELRELGALAASEGTRVVGVAAGGAAPSRATATAASLRWPAEALVALGDAVGRDGLAAALGDLRALLEVARPARGIVRPADHLPELLLHAAPRQAAALAAAVYGPLTDELARTLHALVAHDFDKSAAAGALPVHRNTLAYRVTKIEALTGLDLATAAGRGRAWLATLSSRP